MSVRSERLFKLAPFLVVLGAFAVPSAGLSCAIPPGTVILHCPARQACQADIDSTAASKLGVTIPSEEFPPPNETSNETIETGNGEFYLQTTRSRALPSAEAALQRAQFWCPTSPTYHLYPKTSFQKQALQDTTKCYTTRIQSLENYYLVWREGTTTPLHCVTKVRGQGVSGGETHYVAPAGPVWLLRRPLTLLINLLSN